MDKKAKKIIEGKCRFCGIENIVLLDVHRIIPGCDGGKYVEGNTIISCSNCHRKIHAGQIIVFGRYFCSDGHWKIHCSIDGVEDFV